mmetsp:Transcript_62034/g.134573  ORF Transcript_62034/g.134573 Transcript_62034/m.134573 type:complete len:221 (+) Transcript_62034:545-1207(+)
MRTLRSSEHVAKREPAGSKLRHQTVLSWPTRVSLHDQSSPSGPQILIVSSYEQEKRTSWAGCHRTILTSWLCDCSTATHSYSKPRSVSWIHTDLSLLQVAKYEPDGLKAAAFTSFSWPVTRPTHSKVMPPSSSLASCQSEVVASKEATASTSPEGFHESDRSVLLCRSEVSTSQSKAQSPSAPAVPVRWPHTRMVRSAPQEASCGDFAQGRQTTHHSRSL